MGVARGWAAVPKVADHPSVEESLVRAGQAGDRDALDRLFARHEQPLFTLCRGILGHPEDAEDAAQETFLRALRSLARFRHDASFRTWLFRIAINVCLTRRRNRRPTEPWDDHILDSATDTPSPEAIAVRHLRVAEALAVLPPRHRAVFLLKVQQGWSVAEIAALFHCSHLRVQNDLARARRTLAAWRQTHADEGATP